MLLIKNENFSEVTFNFDEFWFTYVFISFFNQILFLIIFLKRLKIYFKFYFKKARWGKRGSKSSFLASHNKWTTLYRGVARGPGPLSKNQTLIRSWLYINSCHRDKSDSLVRQTVKKIFFFVFNYFSSIDTHSSKNMSNCLLFFHYFTVSNIISMRRQFQAVNTNTLMSSNVGRMK